VNHFVSQLAPHKVARPPALVDAATGYVRCASRAVLVAPRIDQLSAQTSNQALERARDSGHFVVAVLLQVQPAVEPSRQVRLSAGDTHAARWDREGCAAMAWARSQALPPAWRPAEALARRLAHRLPLEEKLRLAQAG
jgi:hypothetical protein